MTLHKEQEQISRRLANVEGLATSLVNQSLVLRQTGHARDALASAEEAYQLAIGHGYAALAKRIEPILNAIRRTV